jgi:hypothetical protein
MIASVNGLSGREYRLVLQQHETSAWTDAENQKRNELRICPAMHAPGWIASAVSDVPLSPPVWAAHLKLSPRSSGIKENERDRSFVESRGPPGSTRLAQAWPASASDADTRVAKSTIWVAPGTVSGAAAPPRAYFRSPRVTSWPRHEAAGEAPTGRLTDLRILVNGECAEDQPIVHTGHRTHPLDHAEEPQSVGNAVPSQRRLAYHPADRFAAQLARANALNCRGNRVGRVRGTLRPSPL